MTEVNEGDATPIATVHINGSMGRGRIAGPFVRAAAHVLGLDDTTAANLAEATSSVVRAVNQRGFDDPADAAVDVSVHAEGHDVVVTIDDLGLPFNYEDVDGADGDLLAEAVRKGWVDELTHAYRGRDGNRTELVCHRHPGEDIRDTADIEEHLQAHAAPEASADEAVVARLATAADAMGIARLTWRTYGYSYQHAEYYQPERLAALIESGAQISFAVASEAGEIIGHSALLFDEPGAEVVEGGRAMVDPRFRGHHLLQQLRDVRTKWIIDNGVKAMVADTVTAHTRSQDHGDEHSSTGVLLAFLPPTVGFRGLAEQGTGRREAVVLEYHVIGAHDGRSYNPPRQDAEMIARVFEHLRLDRTAVVDDAEPAASTRSRIDLEVAGEVGSARLKVREVGADLHAAVHNRVRSMREGGAAAVYADLPLDDPTTRWAAEVLTDLGFFYGGVVPLYGGGRDIVRYQHIGDEPVDPADIHIESPFAQGLLAYVLERRDAVS